jgi:uncharacterized membrane protein YdbT with pleckstrin-like domain
VAKIPMMDNEVVVYEGRINPLFSGIATMAVISVLIAFVSHGLGVFFLSCCALSGVNAYIKFKTSVFLITNKRVIIRVGALTHRSLELNLNKVESVYVQTGVLDRANNMGTLIVAGTGGTKEAFKELADPNTFKLKLQEQLEALANAPQNRVAG